MAMTLADYAATSKDPLVPGVINAILDDNEEGGGNILNYLPVKDVKVLTPTFTKMTSEGSSSTIGFRAINSAYAEGTMTLTQEAVNLGDIGGDIQIDRVFLQADNYVEGASPEVLQIKAKSALINRKVNDTVVNGDRASDPNGFNGLRKWVDSNMVLNITDLDSTATNGIAVGPTATATTQNTFLRALDRLVDYVGNGANACLLMNHHAQWALDWACRERSYLKITEDQYGRKITTYKGLPIMNAGIKNAVETFPESIGTTNAVLPNSRTFGTSTDCCEVFALRKGVDDSGIHLLQFRPLTTEVVTEHMQQGPAKLIRMSWILGLWRPKKSAIAVLKGVRANT
jgi:hypothetical protein